MPDLGFEAAIVLLLLLPGFLCARLVQSFCVRSKQTELDKILEALLFSLIVYTIFALISGTMPISLRREQIEGIDSFRYVVELRPKPLVLLSLIPVLVAVVVGLFTTNDWWGRLFRWARVTQRTTRNSVWSDSFHELSGIVQVELGDGRAVMGWLRYYSDEPQDASLFLERAAWITADGDPVPIDGPGILIRDSGIKHVMFLGRGSVNSSNPEKSEGRAAGQLP